MNLSILTDNELFKLAENQYQFNEHINKEWFERYKMHFPYKLVDGEIYNSILKIKVSEDQCDKLILQQAMAVKNQMVK